MENIQHHKILQSYEECSRPIAKYFVNITIQKNKTKIFSRQHRLTCKRCIQIEVSNLINITFVRFLDCQKKILFLPPLPPTIFHSSIFFLLLLQLFLIPLPSSSLSSNTFEFLFHPPHLSPPTLFHSSLFLILLLQHFFIPLSSSSFSSNYFSFLSLLRK